MPLPWKQVVDLSYHLIKSTNAHCAKPIIINLHGVLGSRRTFNILNKVIREEMNTDIYSIDFRNHGDSAQCLPLTYDVLNNDLSHFIEKTIDPDLIKDRGIIFIGFSMGAKVGLITTIESYNKFNVKKIVSIDMPPYFTPTFPSILATSLDKMDKIDQGEIVIKPGTKTWKEECIKLLGSYFSSGFLDLHSNNKPNKFGHIKYYLPLREFPSLVEDMKYWPENLPPTKCTDTEVLFLRGLDSPVFEDDYSLLDKHFPTRKVVEFATGHTLLFEEFPKASRVILDFLQDKKEATLLEKT